jgi:phage shock protein PspC (stress-responsive transcriptional regulator)
MSDNRTFSDIREALEGRPGQPIVLGVCQAVSRRSKLPVWGVRLATIVLALIWTLPTLAVYVVSGFFLAETEQRTRAFFSGLAVMAREQADKAAEACNRAFGGRGQSGTRGY